MPFSADVIRTTGDNNDGDDDDGFPWSGNCRWKAKDNWNDCKVFLRL